MSVSVSFGHTIPQPALDALASDLMPYIGVLRRVVEQGGYTALECSINVPSDPYMLGAVESTIDRVYSAALKYIFVIGIGGSNLGTKAVYDALTGARDIVSHDQTKLIFIDTVDSQLLLAASLLISQAESADELLFLVISKSGNTTETIANAEILLATFADRFGRNAKRVVVLCQSGSPLLDEARLQSMHTIPLPPMVGGRYSVFTPVGLLPLGLLGLPISAMREHAEIAVEKSLHPDLSLNVVARFALINYYYYRQGIRQHDLFVSAPVCESLGKWWRQLLAESIGKSQVDTGDKIGITPTVSVGSTDLHSVGQLYLGGPKDRLTTFLEITASPKMVHVPTNRVWDKILPYLGGKSADVIRGAIMTGTKASYDANNLPFMTMTMNALTPENISEWMQMKMIETMMLGHLLRVNPFDQPHVEQYKIVTKQILEG